MDAENPYKAPVSTLEAPAVEVPADVLKRIKNAWVAGCISGGLTLVVVLVAMSGADLPGIDAWMLPDVALIFGLTFGIYRKSRTCAVIMLVYYLASKILIMVETGKPGGLFMSALFAYFFWQGVSGTFAYHRFLREASSSSAERA
ncbi:hypothetical protein ACFJIW_21680 [Tahibacter sp. UC22_41]|uniref:hypothetical protein n=1 Tax=Tahibacter sp. UC22_41 TaxID=3350178 RepID=UPI0036DD4507